jgi:hypothetical protein
VAELHGSVVVSIAFALGLYAMRTVLTSPACIDCGKRLVHADDCRRRR